MNKISSIDTRPLSQSEPLVRMEDHQEYRATLERRLHGKINDLDWTAFRTRFGVYGQKQSGVQMIRVKVPGGVIPVPWLKAVAAVNRTYAKADAHLTTRQDFQLYHIPLEQTANALYALYQGGLTTREACGNTLRNMTSCALAGSCNREFVDAGAVASELSKSWIRHPLVQHMPRKMKFTVSGCATDCGSATIHDLGFIATQVNSVFGFKVYAGGGLGAAPIPAALVLDFVSEQDLPRVVETAARLHQRYSDRVNRNNARLKFLQKRFGSEKFIALFVEEFNRLEGLPTRPFTPQKWRNGMVNSDQNAPIPVGVHTAHDGKNNVIIDLPLGLISSDQLDLLSDIAQKYHITQLRATREQNIALLEVNPQDTEALIHDLAAIKLVVPPKANQVSQIISCPGTTTCPIGITNSQSLAKTIVADTLKDPIKDPISVHLSGCQNACGLHHVADIGLHGMAKKIDGKPAPHYQLHVGGNTYKGEVGLSGPIIPARLAHDAVTLIKQAYRPAQEQGQSIRSWATSLGKSGLNDVLAPLSPLSQPYDSHFIDWGEEEVFAGAPSSDKGNCASPFASRDLLCDLADDALINLDRYLYANHNQAAFEAGQTALLYAAKLYLTEKLVLLPDDVQSPIVYQHLHKKADTSLLTCFKAAQEQTELPKFREAVALALDTVRNQVFSA